MQHAVPVGQADRQPPRRHARPDGRRLAEPDQGRTRRCARSSPTCIDIGPTILEAAGIPEPKSVDGIAQEPMDGTSFLYTFDDADGGRAAHHAVLRDVRQPRPCTRTAGGRRRNPTGSRGTSRRRRSRSSAPRPTGTPTGTSAGSCTTCPTTSRRPRTSPPDHPDKVKELQELWWQEAERNRVLPLMGGLSVIYGILPPLPTDHPVHVRRRRAERPARHDPAHPGAVVRHRGRAARARRWRRGRDRRQRRLHRRLRAVGRRQGPAAPHLLVPRASRPTSRSSTRADPDRRRHA